MGASKEAHRNYLHDSLDKPQNSLGNESRVHSDESEIYSTMNNTESLIIEKERSNVESHSVYWNNIIFAVVIGKNGSCVTCDGKLLHSPDKVYHVSVMPCYDKKLEASRDDFVFSMGRQGETGQEAAGPRIAEVDSVLTTGEVLDLIKLKSCDFRSLEEAPLDRLLTNVDEEGHLYGVQGGFGGYADTIFLCAAKRLFGKDMQGPVEFKILRNTDFREATLEVDGKIVLKFVLCYGFRNLQNIVRKIKTGKSDYHFADVRVADPFENPLVKGIYDEWLGQTGSEKAKKYIHTEYHPRASSMAFN
ncbi:hypothetical protein AMTR_s00061p00134950 [Amborella trichopoda]|uniref:Iron hydrogenase small subunit domain-containing protein n=1 Tax=Amborella trichopoda TaxID=13333 RepID=U5DFB8_AMBTC|nr:hypothetical protein AMTR_s00061p00134950 [Amborella trichopoda]